MEKKTVFLLNRTPGVLNGKKNIIYCGSIDTVSEIFLTFKDSLGADAYFDKKKQADNILVEMYHKSTHQDKRMWSISHTSDISYSELSLVICIQYRYLHQIDEDVS
jgi:hypothetical protein